MVTSNKKLSFLVPAFKGIDWLKKNYVFWKEAVEHVDVVLVEDSEEESMKEFCAKLGIKYFSKPNGNWGSVINFAKNKKIISTEWVAVVDVDDTVDFGELEKLLNTFKTIEKDVDVVYTSLKTIDFDTGEEKNHKWKSIHSSWFKTSKFFEMPDLAENVFYTDNFVMAYFLNRKNKSFDAHFISPYNYFINIPGQSIDYSSLESVLRKKPSFDNLEKNIRPFIEQNEIDIKESWIKTREYDFVHALRTAFEKSKKSEEMKKIRQMYKSYTTGKRVPLFRKFIWSYFYRFFIWGKNE